jgi:hypothetical protein
MGNGNMILNKSIQRPVSKRAGLLLVTALLLVFGCSREEKVRELQSDTNAEALAQLDTPEISLEKLLPLQEKIMQQPDSIAFRRELVAASVNIAQKTLRAAGVGLVPENAENTAIAQQAAERAAYLDACRWAAYILKWQKSPDSPAFGEIQGNIPGAQILHKTVTEDGKSVVLVEIALENN